MKQKSFNRNLVWLRICITTFLLAIVSLFLFSFTVTKLTDDIWKQLGLSQMQGTEKIKNSFVNNYFDYYGITRTAKNLAAGDRAAVAKNLLTYVKQYMNSATFKTEYDKLRKQAKPNEPVPNSKTKESIRKDKVEEVQKLIRKTEEIIKSSDGEMKKTMQTVLDMHKKNLADYQDPNSKTIEWAWQDELNVRASDKKRYEENMKNWEVNYPADYKQLIKSRLQRYLELAATVDFSAELVERNGRKYFVNRNYEGKSYEWKMIFRAGKDVYEVAKTFSEQWVKEL